MENEDAVCEAAEAADQKSEKFGIFTDEIIEKSFSGVPYDHNKALDLRKTLLNAYSEFLVSNSFYIRHQNQQNQSNYPSDLRYTDLLQVYKYVSLHLRPLRSEEAVCLVVVECGWLRSVGAGWAAAGASR
jgi:hypothetical protein